MDTDQQFGWRAVKAAKNRRKHKVTFEEAATADYELRDEYDLAKMTIVAKGRYAPERRMGKNVVLLAPDVASAFPTDDAVNAALRLVLQVARIPNQHAASVAGA